MKNFSSTFIQMWVFFLVIGSHPVFACDDPCPSTNLGKTFRNSGLPLWSAKYSESPQRKGISSYHIDESKGLANYIAFIGNTDEILVGEASCDLSGPTWQFLQWQNVNKNETEDFAYLESYYQGNTVKALRKASYAGNKTLYLLTTEFQHEVILIFVLFDAHGRELTRALANPVNSAR